MSDEPIELMLAFDSGNAVKITVSDYPDYVHVIQALKKLGTDVYLGQLYETLVGPLDDEEYPDPPWDQVHDYIHTDEEED